MNMQSVSIGRGPRTEDRLPLNRPRIVAKQITNCPQINNHSGQFKEPRYRMYKLINRYIINHHKETVARGTQSADCADTEAGFRNA